MFSAALGSGPGRGDGHTTIAVLPDSAAGLGGEMRHKQVGDEAAELIRNWCAWPMLQETTLPRGARLEEVPKAGRQGGREGHPRVGWAGAGSKGPQQKHFHSKSGSPGNGSSEARG